ncbi:MAG: hypothetical protein WAU52_03100 [Burkholderiales bacterium]
MTLEQLAWISSVVSAAALVVTVLYASIQIRHNTRAVLASVFQQVVNSFAQISFDIAKDGSLVDLYLRAGREFSSLGDAERAQYSLMLLSFMRRAENVYFQTEIHMLENEHWFGIRESVKAILEPPGARDCWREIKNRLNPAFCVFIDGLIAPQR